MNKRRGFLSKVELYYITQQLILLIGTLQSNGMLNKKPATNQIIYTVNSSDNNKILAQSLQKDSTFYDPSMMHKKVN